MDRMKLKPLGTRMIVDAHDPIDRTESGLWYSDYSIKFPTTGVVIKIGKEVNKKACTCTSCGYEIVEEQEPIYPGDIVLFGQYSKGQPIEIDGRKMYFMTREDINAILK